MCGTERGVVLQPKQNLHLGTWVSFPEPPNNIPFECHNNNDLQLSESNDDAVTLLIESDVVPSTEKDLQMLSVNNVYFSQFCSFYHKIAFT